jgi:hypothetical protein
MLHARHIIFETGQSIEYLANEKIPIFVADGQQWLHMTSCT